MEGLVGGWVANIHLTLQSQLPETRIPLSSMYDKHETASSWAGISFIRRP